MQTVGLSKATRNLLWSLLSAIVVLGIGTIGYRWLGGPQYSWLDSFYMTFITVSTIGYNESVDVTHHEYGKLFTVFIGLTGIGVLGYVLSTVTAFMLEGEFNEVRRRKRMESKIAQLQGHYIVCGMGQIGSNVAQELARAGSPFVMVDMNEANMRSYVERNPAQLYVLGDATDNEVLLAAGIRQACGVFAVAHEDNQNLVISLSVKQLNPRVRVIARCHDPKNVTKIRSAGADEIVLLDYAGGKSLVSAMVHPNVVGFLESLQKSDSKLRLEEIHIPAEWQGAPLERLCKNDSDCAVLAIQHRDDWVINPASTHILHKADVLVVMTTTAGRMRIQEMLRRIS